MGFAKNLFVADLDETRLVECQITGVPPEQVGRDYRPFLEHVDVVDVVTPSTSHFAICMEALRAGKDVFVEKPMTMHSQEAERLASIIADTGLILQVGYYYRVHPIAVFLNDHVRQGRLGKIRYLSGSFMGFKRARTDVGVTKTDAIHFLDLFNWFIQGPPEEVYAVTRDHFERGLEDFSIVLLRYRGGAVGKIESGYVQPGKWRDKVVPDAFTSKEIFVVGSAATIEADFETDTVSLHKVQHEFKHSTWWPKIDGTEIPNVGTANTIQMVRAELTAFLDAVGNRNRPQASVIESGVVLAKIMEAIYESAQRNLPVCLQWHTEELEAFSKELE